MDFPQDIWSEIMSYFHSSYKKPIHYVCMLENNLFYFSRAKNKKMVWLPKQFRSQLNLEMDKVYNSFYMTIVLNMVGNTTFKSSNSIILKRRIAKNKILEDFNNIFEQYKNSDVQLLSNINY